MADVGFLHTAEVHVATFNALADTLGLSTKHRVESAWLASAIESGITDDLHAAVTHSLDELLQDCTVVICTCTTLGDIASQRKSSRLFRVDEPLMHRATEHQGKVLLAYALESTRASSFALLKSAGTPASDITLLDCTADWVHFENNNSQGFGKAIAERIRAQVNDSNSSCVVLAQASMAVAHGFLVDFAVPVYSSPTTAMDHAAMLISDAGQG